MLSPPGDHSQNQREAADQGKAGNPPRQATEPGVRWFHQHRLPIFLDEGLHDQVVRFSFDDSLFNLFQHPQGRIARAGERAADVIASRDRIIATAAHASQLGPNTVRAIGLLCISKRGKKRERHGKTK